MEYKNINDYEVLYMIGEQNEEAYELLFQKYSPLVSNLSRNYINKFNCNGLDYEDLFQQGMYGLSIAIYKYNEKENALFYTFASKCIKNEIINLIKRNITNNSNILNNAISIDKEYGDNNQTLEDFFEDKSSNIEYIIEEIEKTKIVDNLKYKVKDCNMPIIELKLNGFSNKEISSLLDISYKQVDNGLRSIKNSLIKLKNQ